METRKAWRNRDSTAGEGVLALLEALRHGLRAEGVGLFDDDRGDPEPAAGRGALNFWDAFDERPCGSIDWEGWYRELRRNERVESSCGCGQAHRLCGFLIHGRWALLLITPPVIDPGGAAAIASSLRLLAARLPPARTAHESSVIAQYEGDPPSPAAVFAAPVWWVRKLPQ